MLQSLIMTTIAGVAGTGLGGVLGLFIRGGSNKLISYMLSFAGGVMVGIVAFSLIPEALAMTNVWLVTLATILGIVMVMGLGYVIDRFTGAKDSAGRVETHTLPEELHHQQGVLEAENSVDFIKSGLVMFAAIALHNLPEGLAIGSGASRPGSFGFTIALLIAIHNIPEGMTIGVPLMAGGMNKWKAVALTALSGAPTFVGGLIGAAIGEISPAVTAVSLALAGGAMLYVTYCEIMPQVILLNRERRPAFYTIAGILFALIMVALLS